MRRAGSGTLDRPIVILGAARSGTTLIGDTLARHPDVAYWSEPQSVWRSGNAYRRSDVLFAEHATPSVTASIRSSFGAFLASSGRPRFMEKTPSNCLRMPFVLAVFPDAVVVHVVRDGRDVALSAALEWTGRGIPRSDDGRRQPMSGLEKLRVVAKDQLRPVAHPRHRTNWWELPAYLPRASNILRRYLFRNGEALWGPRIPGLRGIRKSYSLLETCAVQWDVCWRMARSACHSLPADRYLEIRYEDLSREPVQHFENILDFAGLPRVPDVLDRARDVIEPQVGRWRRRMDREHALRLDSLIGESLRDLGYPMAIEDEPATSARQDPSKG